MSEKPKRWTKARVLRAYQEWNALQRHAEDVIHRYNESGGHPEWNVEEVFHELCWPSWVGTGWHGEEFEYLVTDSGYTILDDPRTLPFEYLWKTDWEKARRHEYEVWEQSQEAKEQEAIERREYERLKEKYDA